MNEQAQVTPMMLQYMEIKAAHKDALLFYRMGDFYEMFFEDAVAAAEALDIALTKRGKHLGQDIQMCGVPVHAAEGYLLTLIRKGFRVAICDQVEDPADAKKRGSKSVVKREVVRLVTPGTLTEDALLDARRHNYLAAFAEVRDEGALAWCDISTGELRVTPCAASRLGPELARLAPREVLMVSGQFRDLIEDIGAALTELSAASFDSQSAGKRLCDVFGVAEPAAFGLTARAEIAALGAIIDWLDITQKGALPRLQVPVRELPGGQMQIDAATRRSLEITRGADGGRAGSLLATVDLTVTAAGARLLERRLAAPSCDEAVIAARLDAVSFFVADHGLRAQLRDDLRRVPDIDRALSRLALGRGGPRDLLAIRNALAAAKSLSGVLACALPDLLASVTSDLSGHEELFDLLNLALVAEPPLLARDGGFVASGYDAELDETRRLRDEGRGVVAAMEAEYVRLSGVTALKIRHNNVLGYYVETPSTHAEKMLAAPLNETFIHRQTNANAIRFTTRPLSEIETKILNAGGHALSIEARIFNELQDATLAAYAQLTALACALAEIDLAASLAELAVSRNWKRPHVDGSRDFQIIGGRHPVVEAALAKQGASFVANDCEMAISDGAALWLLTGPNMAGKSTFLRQNALIVLLAQAGSYVPADEAKIGIVTQLFSRVGASDDLARGRSTFMVEMLETAAILNQADERSFVILDEIGRGTATYDGLSIAWATLEHLHEVGKVRGLFATHYHEMTALAEKLQGVENATVTVKEWDHEIIFLHEIKKGAADRSYGVQVAKLAGLPDAVISRARVVLDALEQGDREGKGQKVLIDDLPLFSARPQQKQIVAKDNSPALERLERILPDTLTPLEALNLLYELKALSANKS